MNYFDTFDVIVVGGGHAGTEASLASARMGCKTLLLTHNIETLGQMSCNPSIGGIGKTHLVKEIDALDGIMAKATDMSGIHFRVLNRRKGPAVRATRAQADREKYKAAVRYFLENQKNLSIFQASVDNLILNGSEIKGVITSTGISFFSATVVITAGTFLAGKIHVGLQNFSGGRAGDQSATLLSEYFRSLPFRVERLKTGTPPRIDKGSVDLGQLQEQWGDEERPVMSYLGNIKQHPEQICCWIAHTNESTHQVIKDSLHKSPLYTGSIEGIGPRYCPSIEDKIIRFSDKDQHQVFIEPEGLNTNELYPNGISTSLPFETQIEFLRTIKGFERANITRPGYAIEYDFFNPQDLNHTLESKIINSLYFAGQINGTTGYEEAAAQGLLAGLNAGLKVLGKDPWYPRRDQAYIGVLVDDLINYGTNEPYRMFTSRAEYRLLLREDNADSRLSEIGRSLGVVGEHRWAAFSEKRERLEFEKQKLKEIWINPDSRNVDVLSSTLPHKIEREYSFFELLKRPEITYKKLVELFPEELGDSMFLNQIETDIKYEGYITRQEQEIIKLKRNEKLKIPLNFKYDEIKGLSNEVKQKLQEIKPPTLAAAMRIPGVTSASISLLLIQLKKHAA